MARANKKSEYTTTAAQALLADAKPKREALTASQKALQDEFTEQRRIENIEHAQLDRGNNYLEREEHLRRYNDAFKRSRELEVLHYKETQKRPEIDPALVNAARVELQDNYIAYLERICVLYEQIEAETRRYYQAAGFAYNAGKTAIDHTIEGEAQSSLEAAVQITNLSPSHKFVPADRVCRIKAHLQRAKQDREKIAG